MTETSEQVTWLTQEAYDRLSGELEHLSGPGRVEIAKKIEAAREEGDLRENGGYHAAKEEQGKQEARIRQIRHLLEKAQVGEPPAASGKVEPGRLGTVDLAGEEMTFLLGSREVTVEDLEVYSERSPLGSAILGRRIGEQVSYQAPNGRSLPVKILDSKPFTG